MYAQEVTIQNEQGFHIRPAQLFVEIASHFDSMIRIRAADGTEADAKSILGLMGLGLDKGSMITLCAEGEDEQSSVETLVRFIRSGLGEE